MIKLDQIPENERLALIRIYEEYLRACKKFGTFKSAHEAYGVVMEEIEEWWHLVKNHDKPWGGIENQKAEIQSVGAMALRFLVEM